MISAFMVAGLNVANADECAQSIAQLSQRNLRDLSTRFRLWQFRRKKDPESYLQMIWASHDNVNYSGEGALKGFSRRREHRLARTMRANRNFHLPAFFLLNDKKGLGKIIDDVVNNITQSSGKKAEEEVAEWITEYKAYRTNISEFVFRGFQALGEGPEYEEILEQAFKEQFGNGNILSRRIPQYHRGEASEQLLRTVNTPSLPRAMENVDRANDIVNHTFNFGLYARLTGRNDILERMYAQEIMRLRLKYIKDAIQALPPSRVRAGHRRVLAQIDEALADTTLLAPGFVVTRAQWSLWIHEMLSGYTINFFKQRRLSNQRTDIPETAFNSLMNAPILKNYRNTVITIGSASFAVSYAWGLMEDTFNDIMEIPEIAQVTTWPGHRFQLLLYQFGYVTKDIKQCGMKFSGSSSIQSCITAIIESRTDHFKAKSRANEEYDMFTDDEYLELTQMIAEMVIEISNEYQGPTRLRNTKARVDQIIEGQIDQTAMNLLVKEFDLDDEGEQHVFQYFMHTLVTKDQELAETYLASIEHTINSETMLLRINAYMQKRDDLISHFKSNIDQMPQEDEYEDLVSFIRENS